MVGVGEEDLKQKEKAQLNYLLSVPKRAFRHFRLGILSQDYRVLSRSIDTAQLSRVQRANGKLTTQLHCSA